MFVLPVAGRLSAADGTTPAEQPAILRVELRNRVEAVPGSGQVQVVTKTSSWDPKRTAIIVCDMWNMHHCAAAERRTGELAVPINEAVKSARAKGVFVIHSPSDCMKFYQDTPQRKRAQEAPRAKAPVPLKWNNEDPKREPPLPVSPGCACDTPLPCNTGRRWTKQHDAIAIAAEDAISDNGQEIYNLLQARRIENVILVGVHTNICVMGRPFGIRQMVYLGKNVVLCRDLTDSYHRDPGRHFQGLEKVIEHVERYWCATISSTSLTGKPAFRFAEDHAPK
jgi:nicotinamidase-related amidase